MAKNIRIAAVASLIAVFGAGTSNSATLSKSVECFRGSCSSITGFDATLGTLQSVSFQGLVTDDAAFGLFNLSDETVEDVVTISSIFQFSISKSGSSINLTGSDEDKIPFSFSPYASSILVTGGSANVSGGSTDVSGFVGPGLVSFDLNSDIRASANKLLITGESVRRLGEGYFGNLIFEYSAVPEPASWMLLIGGFGVLGAAGRRERRVTMRTLSPDRLQDVA